MRKRKIVSAPMEEMPLSGTGFLRLWVQIGISHGTKPARGATMMYKRPERGRESVRLWPGRDS